MILNPTLDVDVACPEIVRPESVVVPKPRVDTENTDDVAAFSMFSAVRELTGVCSVVSPPYMLRRARGVEVPIPTRPVDVTMTLSLKFKFADDILKFLLAVPL